jgi:hypothetical protein
MHRQIVGLSVGDPREADHINGNRLDNRHANLRVVPGAGNRQNKRAYRNGQSGLRGVVRRGARWRAQAQLNGRNHFLGSFKTPEEAATAAAAFRAARMPYSAEALARRTVEALM